MNVNDSFLELPDEIFGQDLHVASHDDEVDFKIREQLQLSGFNLCLALRVYGKDVKGNPELLRDGTKAFVITDDQRDIAMEFA